MTGAGSHYFILAHSFWAMCFIANTYAVIIHDNRAVFKHPIKIHLMQSVLSWLVPAFIVAGCLYFAPPGYTFLFMDHMSAGAQSIQMAYFTFTLPMQVTIYVSLHLLWSIVWHLRKVKILLIYSNYNFTAIFLLSCIFMNFSPEKFPCFLSAFSPKLISTVYMTEFLVFIFKFTALFNSVSESLFAEANKFPLNKVLSAMDVSINRDGWNFSHRHPMNLVEFVFASSWHPSRMSAVNSERHY